MSNPNIPEPYRSMATMSNIALRIHDIAVTLEKETIQSLIDEYRGLIEASRGFYNAIAEYVKVNLIEDSWIIDGFPSVFSLDSDGFDSTLFNIEHIGESVEDYHVYNSAMDMVRNISELMVTDKCLFSSDFEGLADSEFKMPHHIAFGVGNLAGDIYTIAKERYGIEVSFLEPTSD